MKRQEKETFPNGVLAFCEVEFQFLSMKLATETILVFFIGLLWLERFVCV